jgi:hypothetical protein
MLSQVALSFVSHPLVITLAAIALILWAVLSESKHVGALAQLGGLQERELSHRSLIARAAQTVAAARAELHRERLVFTLGVVNVAATFYILGSRPTYFYLWHTPKSVVLIFMRWLAFLREKPAQHYLLLDFCYWANLLLLLYCWVVPHSHVAFEVLFVAANGPLAWSVLAFNQSLVFHDWQRITSVFIHVSPMLFTFGLRWNVDDRFSVCADPPGCASVTARALVTQTLRYFYVPWILGYYLIVFLLMGSYIRKKGFQTLFDRVATKGPLAPLLSRIASADKDPQHLLAKTVYIAIHFCFGTATMLLSTVFFHSQAAHIFFIVAICTASAINAGGFYFTVFPKEISKLMEDATPRSDGLGDPKAAGAEKVPEKAATR